MAVAVQTRGNGQTLLIAVMVAVIGPLLLSWLNGCQRQAERAEDWRRQDLVAARAAEVAVQAKESADNTNEKLDVIHKLVNSQLSTALKNELEALVRERAMMTELIELKKANGLEPTATAAEAIATSQARITELRGIIKDRTEQQEAIDAQTAE